MKRERGHPTSQMDKLISSLAYIILFYGLISALHPSPKPIPPQLPSQCTNAMKALDTSLILNLFII